MSPEWSRRDAWRGRPLGDDRHITQITRMGQKKFLQEVTEGTEVWFSLSVGSVTSCEVVCRVQDLGGIALMWKMPQPWPSGSRKLWEYMKPRSSGLS